MTAKKPKKSPKRDRHSPAFIGVSDNTDIVFTARTLEEAGGKAEELIEKGEYDSLTILCVVGAWYAEMPPQQIELKEMELREFLEGED